MKIIKVSMQFIFKATLVSALLLITLTTHGQVNLQNGLVAKYLFNQNADDSGPNSLNASLHGSPTFVDDHNGNPNSAISLDGINDYVKILNNSLLSFGAGNFSVSFWVNKQISSANSPGHSNSFGVNQWKTGGATPSQNEWSVSVAQGGTDDSPVFAIESGSSILKVASTSELTISQWHHVVGVRNGDQLKIYFDGNLNNTFNIPANTIVNDNGNDLLIGANNNLNYFTKAYFDDISIYDRAINDNEVAELYLPTSGNLCTANCTEISFQKLSIGTSQIPDNYILAVNGAAIMEEVKVQLKEEWPDYVFEANYDLPSLKDTKAYIQKNKHLKGIPSASDVHNNGIELGKMNTLLLEKIEELTLHQIHLMELLEKQQKEIEELKKSE